MARTEQIPKYGQITCKTQSGLFRALSSHHHDVPVLLLNQPNILLEIKTVCGQTNSNLI